MATDRVPCIHRCTQHQAYIHFPPEIIITAQAFTCPNRSSLNLNLSPAPVTDPSPPRGACSAVRPQTQPSTSASTSSRSRPPSPDFHLSFRAPPASAESRSNLLRNIAQTCSIRPATGGHHARRDRGCPIRRSRPRPRSGRHRLGSHPGRPVLACTFNPPMCDVLSYHDPAVIAVPDWLARPAMRARLC